MDNKTTNAFVEMFLYVIRRDESAPIEELIREVRLHRIAMRQANEVGEVATADFMLCALGTQLWRNRTQELGNAEQA